MKTYKGYLLPDLDDTFDRIAAEQLRACMDMYETAPLETLGLLENIACLQQAAKTEVR
jgi:hypothetical protein